MRQAWVGSPPALGPGHREGVPRDLRQRPADGRARLRVLDGPLQRWEGGAHGRERDERPVEVEGDHGARESLPLLAEPEAGWDARAVEEEGPARREPFPGALVARAGDPGAVQRDEKR